MILYDDITSSIMNHTTLYKGKTIETLKNEVFHEVRKEYEVLNDWELKELIIRSIFTLIYLGFLNVIHSFIFRNNRIHLLDNIPQIVNEEYEAYLSLYEDIL